jgi:hypothetical protein
MATSPAWQTSMRGRGAGLGQNSFRPLAGPAAQAASPCGGNGCCFDAATVSETLVLWNTFVKQYDHPDAPTGAQVRDRAGTLVSASQTQSQAQTMLEDRHAD